MIKFKQKEFVVGAILNGVSAVSGVGSLMQGSSQMKQQEEQMDQQKKQMKDLTKAMNNVAANAANNPQAANDATQIAGQAVQQQFSQRRFSKYNLGDVKGLGKDLWSFAKTPGVKNWAKEQLAFGGLMAVGSYGADKLIQRDQKSREEESSGVGKKLAIGGATIGALALHPRTRSIMTRPLRYASQKTGVGLSHAAGGLAMGAAFPAIGYLATRSQEQGAVDNTSSQRQYSIGSVLSRYGNKALNWGGWNNYKRGIKSDFVTKDTQGSAWKTIKSIFSRDPNRSARGLAKTINNLNMAGGETGLKSFHDHLVKPGGSNSKLTEDVANFINNHKTTALLGASAAGMAGMAATFDLGEKVANKGLRVVDKNAYKYQDSQEEQLQ